MIFPLLIILIIYAHVRFKRMKRKPRTKYPKHSWAEADEALEQVKTFLTETR